MNNAGAPLGVVELSSGISYPPQNQMNANKAIASRRLHPEKNRSVGPTTTRGNHTRTNEISLSLTLWRQKPVSPARAHRGLSRSNEKYSGGLPAFLSVSCPSTASGDFIKNWITYRVNKDKLTQSNFLWSGSDQSNCFSFPLSIYESF